MNDFFESEAQRLQLETSQKTNEERYKSELAQIESFFISLSTASEDERQYLLQSIADIAGTIWVTAFRDSACREYAKKYLGRKSEYDKYIKPLIPRDTDSREDRNPIEYDIKRYKMKYIGEKGSSIIADDFLLYVRYCLVDEDENTRWILELKRKTESLTIEISNDDFSSVKKLKTILLSKKYSLIITESQMAQLHSYLLNQRPKDAKKIIRLGYDLDSESYIMSNGVYANGHFHQPNENGIIELDKAVISMPIFDKEKAERHWFRYVKPDGSMTIQKWFYHFASAYDFELATQVFGFYLFSTFRDIIIQQKGSSPILFLKGVGSSGKSTIAKLILSLYGIPPKEGLINLKNNVTKPAINRIFSSISNATVWVDEYEANHHIESVLQASFDNAGLIKAKQRGGDYNTGLEVESPPLKCSSLVTTNNLPTHEPFFLRCLYLPVNKVNYSEEQRHHFHILRNYEDTGLSYITAEIQKHRGAMKKEFRKRYERFYDLIKKEVKNTNIPTRLIENQAIIMATFFIIDKQEHFTDGVFTNDTLETWLVIIASKQITNQFHTISDNSLLRIFFEILQRMYTEKRLLPEKEFTFWQDSRGSGEDHLVLRFGTIWGKFKYYWTNQYRTNPPDKKSVEDEIAKFLGEEDTKKIYTSNSFVPLKESDDFDGQKKVKYPVKDSIRFPYKKLQDLYHVDFMMFSANSYNS